MGGYTHIPGSIRYGVRQEGTSMFGSSRNVILSTGLACVLALGAMGCSASVESTSTTEVSTTDEDGTTTTTTTETKTGADTENGVTNESSTESSVVISLSEWEDGWIGNSDKGYKVFYAQAPSGTKQALLVIQDPNTQELYSFLGNYEVPQQGVVAITDAGAGNKATVVASDETAEGVTLDLGSDFGKAECKTTPFDEFIAELKKVDTEHQVLE